MIKTIVMLKFNENINFELTNAQPRKCMKLNCAVGRHMYAENFSAIGRPEICYLGAI